MAKMIETVLRGSKGYKGCVRWVKLAFPSGVYRIERRRPYGCDSYRITKAEYDFVDTLKKAEAVWAYHHYMGTASWWGGEIKHPMPELNAIADDVLANADQYKQGLHYNSSLVDVVSWMFHDKDKIAACNKPVDEAHKKLLEEISDKAWKITETVAEKEDITFRKIPPADWQCEADTDEI